MRGTSSVRVYVSPSLLRGSDRCDIISSIATLLLTIAQNHLAPVDLLMRTNTSFPY